MLDDILIQYDRFGRLRFYKMKFNSTVKSISSATERGQVSSYRGTRFTFTIMWRAGLKSRLLNPLPTPLSITSSLCMYVGCYVNIGHYIVALTTFTVRQY